MKVMLGGLSEDEAHSFRNDRPERGDTLPGQVRSDDGDVEAHRRLGRLLQGAFLGASPLRLHYPRRGGRKGPGHAGTPGGPNRRPSLVGRLWVPWQAWGFLKAGMKRGQGRNP